MTYGQGGTVSSRLLLNKDSTLTKTNVRRVTRSLHNGKAKKIKTVLSSSEDYATFPVEAAYCAITHTDLVPAMRELGNGGTGNTGGGDTSGSHFIPTAKYGSRMGITSMHERGSFEEARYLATPDHGGWKGAGSDVASSDDAAAYMTSTGGTHGKFDVYPVIYLGRDAFATVVLRGKGAVEPKVLNAGIPRAGDPLGQRGTVGWLMWHSDLITNQAWMHRLEVVAAD